MDQGTSPTDVEDADIGTSSEDYARRFTGAVGRWFVETQARLTLAPSFVARASVSSSPRFSGPVGCWFVEPEAWLSLMVMGALPMSPSILDVGGGRALIAPPIIEAGFEVTVVDNDPVCDARL